jgi:hypothetical protein
MRKDIQKLTQTHACFPVPYLNILNIGNTKKDNFTSHISTNECRIDGLEV